MSSIINMVTSMKTKWACAVAVAGLADTAASFSEAEVVFVVTLVGALVGACVVVVVVAGGVPEQQPHCVMFIASRLQTNPLLVPVKLAKSE